MSRFSLQNTHIFLVFFSLLWFEGSPAAYAQATLPLMVYEFDKPTLAENGWSEPTGGYSGRPAGLALLIGFIPGTIESSKDQKGLAIIVKPNEVAFIQDLFPVNTEGAPVLVRMTVRADSPNASVALGALRGDLNTGNHVDGSIATHIPASAASFVDEERRIILMYEPDNGNLITPVIQVAATGQTGNVTIYVDRLEILKLDTKEFGSKLPSLPTPTMTSTFTPIYTPTPVSMLPTNSPTPGVQPQTITIPLTNLPSGAKPLEMVLIPAGTFLMGSPENEKDGFYILEGPQHWVTISKPFYMGKYEVTQAQWRAVIGDNPSEFEDDNNPVGNVSWYVCQVFIEKLNQMGQGMFRLPTEAEWEYACRAGTTTRFYWGDDPNNAEIVLYAWSANNSKGRTHDVGSKLPNLWGLFDMSGNAAEWCQDYSGWYSNNAQIDPTGPSFSESNYGNRIIRGGSYSRDAGSCRSAKRNWDYPDQFDSVDNGQGFRLARNP